MHTIEKEVLVESLSAKIFAMYKVSCMGGYIASKNITMPSLVFECKGKGTAGHYMPAWNGKPPHIMINLAYYSGGSTANLECTIAHEIAHHIVHCIWPGCKQWHGAEFRMVMQSIGYDGSTYHSMSKAVAKVVASKAKDELFPL